MGLPLLTELICGSNILNVSIYLSVKAMDIRQINIKNVFKIFFICFGANLLFFYTLYIKILVNL